MAPFPFVPRLSLILKSCFSSSNSVTEFFFIRSMMALMSFKSTAGLSLGPMCVVVTYQIRFSNLKDSSRASTLPSTAAENNQPARTRQQTNLRPYPARKPLENSQKQPFLGRFSPFVNVKCRFHSQNVRICPKSDNLPPAHRRNERFVPELLPGMDVRQVDFDGRHPHSRDGVAQSHTGMGIGRRVQDNRIERSLGLLNPSHQIALLVGLPELHSHPQLLGPLMDLGLNIGQRRPPIDFGLALPEQVQIRAV